MSAPAPSPAEAATIARFGIFEAEERVEQVARAMAASDAACEAAPEWHEMREDLQDGWTRRAVAAIAAMPPSPAEEAVKRVEALAEEWSHTPLPIWTDAAVAHLRAALAPQAGEAGQ